MPGLSSVEKQRVGIGDSRMGTKENQITKAGIPGVLRKKLKHTIIQKYVFLEIPINVKADRVK
jgi:hypothetical protein